METTSTETNKKIARQFFEYFGKGDTKSVEGLLGSDYQFHFPGKAKALTAEESIKVMQEYNSAFADVKFNIELQVAEGDKVVTRVNLSGTNKGSFQGVPASGKKVSTNGITIHRIVNGKIVEEWTEFDAMGLMQQIGGIPEMTSTNYK